MTRKRLNDVISFRLPEDLRQKILDVSKGDISSFVRSAIEEKLADALSSPELLEERLNQLELELQKLELEIKERELQKLRIEKDIQRLKEKIEEIRKKQEEEAQKLRLTDKAIRIVKAVFCAEEPANEEIAEIVEKVGRLNVKKELESKPRLKVCMAIEAKSRALEDVLHIPAEVLLGLAVMFVDDVKETYPYHKFCVPEARAWLIKNGDERYALDANRMG